MYQIFSSVPFCILITFCCQVHTAHHILFTEHTLMAHLGILYVPLLGIFYTASIRQILFWRKESRLQVSKACLHPMFTFSFVSAMRMSLISSRSLRSMTVSCDWYLTFVFSPSAFFCTSFWCLQILCVSLSGHQCTHISSVGYVLYFCQYSFNWDHSLLFNISPRDNIRVYFFLVLCYFLGLFSSYNI